MRRSGGFTLIEVMGALIIFSLGVLMTLNLSDALGEQLDRAAIRSELMARARTRLDSLQAVEFTSLAPNSNQVNFTVRGRSYRETVQVSSFSPLVMQLSVSLEPTGGATGPRHAVTSYTSGRW